MATEETLIVEGLASRLAWPFGEEFHSAGDFLARIIRRPFAKLEVGRGSYLFQARLDKYHARDVWLEVTYVPAGEQSLEARMIYRRLSNDLEEALAVVQRHLAAGQPEEEWEGAEIEEKTEEEWPSLD